MDAWEILFDNSTLGAGNDAWKHLNAQTGGGETIIISGAVEANVEDIEISVTVTNVVDAAVEVSDPVTAKAENVVAVSVSEENIEVGVCS